MEKINFLYIHIEEGYSTGEAEEMIPSRGDNFLSQITF